MKKNDKIIITGGTGLVGSALTSILKKKGFSSLYSLGSSDCDLTDFRSTVDFFQKIKPNFVFHLAAAVYGIMGNMQNKGVSYLNNTLINTSVVEASRVAGVKKIVCMGSGCVYPYPSPSLPLKEEMIWDGAPHASEDSYAHSKRGMLAQLNAYRESFGLQSAFVISGNLYGPNDKFDSKWGHVTPALICKFYEALKGHKPVVIWGDGSSQRDFMYSFDAASALLMIMETLEGPVNLGSGQVYSIRNIVDTISEVSEFPYEIQWDASMPNGQEYRSYDLSKLVATGFQAKTTLLNGIQETWDWYTNNYKTARH